MEGRGVRGGGAAKPLYLFFYAVLRGEKLLLAILKVKVFADFSKARGKEKKKNLDFENIAITQQQ